MTIRSGMYRASLLVAGGAGMVVSNTSTANVIQQGTQDWAATAKVSRSDMLILGDSVTWVSGFGWDQGMIKAGLNTFGLAGTGLITDGGMTGEGYGYGVYGGAYFGNGYDTSLDAVPADRRGYALRVGAPNTAGATPIQGRTTSVTGESLDPAAAYDLHVYSASAAGGGTMGALRRINGEVNGVWYPTLQSLPTVATATPAKGLQETVFSFAAQPSYPNASMEFRLTDSTNTSVLYSRLTRPGATGLTVSSIGYGSHGTHDFYDNILSTMDAAGRSTYLANLVDDGSGKLNVMIAQGLNDRNDDRPSIHGVAAGKTAEGFRDNISSLIAMLRADWAAAGFAPNDLSFTLVGMYETADNNDPLQAFSAVEAGLAAGDTQISFVDLMDLAPDYATASATGYFRDAVHPSAAGAEAFSSLIMGSIAQVPEPALLGLVAVPAVLLRRRRNG